MAFLSKLKDIFYDKVEVDEPEEENESFDTLSTREVREEKPLVREIKPKEDEEDEKPLIDLSDDKDDSFSERDLFRNEKPFTFTELEDDDLPPRKSVLDMDRREVKPAPVTIEERTREVERERYTDTQIEQPRVFKPTPVISPIYGILDKDYKKEEIKEKNPVNSNPVVSATTTYDSVRRKAYGTLEDDLEDTLNKMNKLSTEDVNGVIDNTPDTEDLEETSKTLAELNEKTQKIENLINKIEEATDELDRTMSIGELEDTAKLENFETEDVKTIGTLEEDKKDKTMTDSTLEHDLFNLIDSMYDDKED